MKEIPLRNLDETWMYVFVCWAHLQKVKKCKNCIDYYKEKSECRHPAPYFASRTERGARWTIVGPEDHCGQWTARDSISINEII